MAVKSTLIIFTKNPVLGKVKTRLASTMGDETALDVYQNLLQITRSASQKADCNRLLFYSDFIPEKDDWNPEFFAKHLQSAGDLGTRMESAFRFAFENGANKVVIIGSDCPEISNEILSDAFEALDEYDFVLGPATDGGYYLLGMQSPTPELFSQVKWSTEGVLEETIRRIREKEKSFLLLTVLTDIDTENDLKEFPFLSTGN